MVLGVPLATVIDRIGHDGSRITYTELKDPYNRESFHIQELIAVAYKMGYFVIPFEPYPILNHSNGYDHCRVLTMPGGNETRMLKLFQQHNGVLTGKSKNGTDHAVAWDCTSERIYNPIGQIETLDTFSIQTFWLVQSNVLPYCPNC